MNAELPADAATPERLAEAERGPVVGVENSTESEGPRARRSRSPRLLAGWAVLGLAVVVLSAYGYSVLSAPSTGPASSPAPSIPPVEPPQTVVAGGTVLQLAAHAYQDVPFTIQNESILNGTVRGSAAVNTVIMQGPQLQALSRGESVAAAGYDWQTGNLTKAVLDPVLGAGSYYVVFDNPGSAPVTVTIVSEIDAAVFDSG